MDEDTAQQALHHAEMLKHQEDQEAKVKNTFSELVKVDCSQHIEHKNGFSYLSWPFAVKELRKHCPDATWEVKRNESGEPFFATRCGFFVEVAVTVDGITLSQIHPVLDHANRPVTQPNAFHINTSIQRCLVKAIALHGLGLSIYGGEDVPKEVVEEREAKAAEEAAKPITEKQLKDLEALLGKVGGNPEKICNFLKINSLAEIPSGRYDSVINSIKKNSKEVA